LDVDELFFEYIELFIIQLEPHLEGTVRDASFALEQRTRLVQDVREFHPAVPPRVRYEQEMMDRTTRRRRSSRSTLASNGTVFHTIETVDKKGA
jgi:hypothetical protein